jgi:hypothetical protein
MTCTSKIMRALAFVGLGSYKSSPTQGARTVNAPQKCAPPSGPNQVVVDFK